MSAKNVFFHNEETKYIVKNKNKIKQWVVQSAEKEGFAIENLNIIICSDDYLLKINQDYLNHDYYTDIITFQHSDNQNIEGDLFLSIDTIKGNSKINSTSLINELHRVIIHGTLHLMGYKDKTKAESQQMRAKEDYYLSLRTF